MTKLLGEKLEFLKKYFFQDFVIYTYRKPEKYSLSNGVKTIFINLIFKML